MFRQALLLWGEGGMAEFELHPQLLADTHWIGDLPLCRVLLMNNSNFPWLVLVPRRVGLRELFELSDADQLQWLAECNLISRVLVAELAAEKLNIAALGNMVPQLHIHCLARFQSDLAWPAPVWGKAPAVAYLDEALIELLTRLRAALHRGGLVFVDAS